MDGGTDLGACTHSCYSAAQLAGVTVPCLQASNCLQGGLVQTRFWHPPYAQLSVGSPSCCARCQSHSTSSHAMPCQGAAADAPRKQANCQGEVSTLTPMLRHSDSDQKAFLLMHVGPCAAAQPHRTTCPATHNILHAPLPAQVHHNGTGHVPPVGVPPVHHSSLPGG